MFTVQKGNMVHFMQQLQREYTSHVWSASNATLLLVFLCHLVLYNLKSTVTWNLNIKEVGLIKKMHQFKLSIGKSVQLVNRISINLISISKYKLCSSQKLWLPGKMHLDFQITKKLSNMQILFNTESNITGP